MPDIYGAVTPADLAGFSQQVRQQDPYGMVSASLNQWQPNYSTMNAGESAATAFGKALIAGLAGGYANNRANRQLESVVSVLPQLKSNPMGMAVPEGVDRGAFSLLRGIAATRGDEQERLIDAERRKFDLDMLGKVLGKRGEIIGEQQGYDALGQGGVNTNSPVYKADQDVKKGIDDLRKEFQGKDIYKDFQTSLIGFRSLSEAIKDPESTSDLELVRGAIQAIEPGMAVREGEQAAVAASASIPAAWKGALNKALSGGTGLGDDVRKGIMRIAARRYKEHATSFNDQRDLYRGTLAKRRNYDPDQVVLEGAAPSVEEIYPEYVAPGGEGGGSAFESFPPYLRPMAGESKEQHKARLLQTYGKPQLEEEIRSWRSGR